MLAVVAEIMEAMLLLFCMMAVVKTWQRLGAIIM
jgi:hypothetical protein